jgi:hypothetical protein
MLNPHGNFGVAVVNDELYAISGSIENFKPPSVANEKYTPIGYGTPDSFTPSPSPSPSPTPTPEPTYSPEPTITPTPYEEPQPSEQDMTAGAILAVISIVVFLGLLFYFIKGR